ncbi:dTDP-glucose 4,6-dehydratase [Brevundimonas subvibrioides]
MTLCSDAKLHDLDLAGPADAIVASIAALRPDAIVHCAAYGVDYRENDPSQAIAVNVQGASALVLAAASASVSRFVHIGTSSEYGIADGAITESTPLHPAGVYGSTKAAGLVVARERARSLGLSFIAARAFGMYGPLEGGHKFVPQVMQAAREGMTIELTPGGQVRDYTYVGDIADACVAMADGGGGDDRIVNLASGRPLTLRQLGDAAAFAAGGGADLRWGAQTYRPAEPMSVLADPSLARSLLSWEATTPLADGMAQTAHYEKFRSRT